MDGAFEAAQAGWLGKNWILDGAHFVKLKDEVATWLVSGIEPSSQWVYNGLSKLKIT